MITFIPTVFGDYELIKHWIEKDPWHSHKDVVEWWIAGAYLTFKLVDREGPVLFVRMDRDKGTMLRLHTQFAPPDEVSEKRTAIAILQGIQGFIPHAKANGVTGIVTESVSPKLVAFLKNNLNFEEVSGSPNDYQLVFSEGQ